MTDLLQTAPVPELLRRVRRELSASFDPTRPMLVSRAPGRLDVMGGIADYTGSDVYELPLACAAAVATQDRSDGQVSVVSFNLLDRNVPFQVQMPAAAFGRVSPEQLRADLSIRQDAHGGNDRLWAGYVLGCLSVLVDRNLLDAARIGGLNVALLSDVPSGAGVSSSAAVEVATMRNLVARYGLDVDGVRLAELCQEVENRVVGAPCGLMDQMASSMGEAGRLMHMRCQPAELLGPLTLPAGTRVLGLNSNVTHSVGGGDYGRTRCAAFMGHTLILHQMWKMAAAAGKTMTGDPTRGYLANLDPDDYKRHFRPALPEQIAGRDFLDAHGDTADPVTTPDPDVSYDVQAAVDHHVLEAARVRRFGDFLRGADGEADPAKRKLALDSAGHLMYASHHSYTHNAKLGDPACDALVELVRREEPNGLYGAKITGGGSGGTVAILAATGHDAPQDVDEQVDAAIAAIRAAYHERTGNEADLITGTSDGAWRAGVADVPGG